MIFDIICWIVWQYLIMGLAFYIAFLIINPRVTEDDKELSGLYKFYKLLSVCLMWPKLLYEILKDYFEGRKEK